jgi:hypothetical protein
VAATSAMRPDTLVRRWVHSLPVLVLPEPRPPRLNHVSQFPLGGCWVHRACGKVQPSRGVPLALQPSRAQNHPLGALTHLWCGRSGSTSQCVSTSMCGWPSQDGRGQ